MGNTQNKRPKTKSLIAFQIGHAAVWAVVMLGLAWLFRGQPVIKDAIIWLPLAYIILNGILLAIIFGRSSQ